MAMTWRIGRTAIDVDREGRLRLSGRDKALTVRRDHAPALLAAVAVWGGSNTDAEPEARVLARLARTGGHATLVTVTCDGSLALQTVAPDDSSLPDGAVYTFSPHDAWRLVWVLARYLAPTQGADRMKP